MHDQICTPSLGTTALWPYSNGAVQIRVGWSSLSCPFPDWYRKLLWQKDKSQQRPEGDTHDVKNLRWWCRKTGREGWSKQWAYETWEISCNIRNLQFAPLRFALQQRGALRLVGRQWLAGLQHICHIPFGWPLLSGCSFYSHLFSLFVLFHLNIVNIHAFKGRVLGENSGAFWEVLESSEVVLPSSLLHLSFSVTISFDLWGSFAFDFRELSLLLFP